MIRYARGTVWFAELPDAEDTHQTAKPRPVLIISNNEFNKSGPTVTVLPMTTKEHDYPFRVALDSGNPNKDNVQKSYVMCDQIRNVDKQILKNYMGIVSDWEMIAIQKTLYEYLSLADEAVLK